MIKMVVFDMAGTTVNENNVVYKTLQKVYNSGTTNRSRKGMKITKGLL
jgi:hypothetical protein